MGANAPSADHSPSILEWLADAPLFIDSDQIHSFYDAVVRPEAEGGTTTLEITDEQAGQIFGELGAEVTFSPGRIVEILKAAIPGLKADVKVSGKAQAERGSRHQQTATIELHPITTPQRQLVALTLYYFANYPHRFFFVDRPSKPEWRHPATISSVPRQLVYLDLPGQQEAHYLGPTFRS